MPAELRERIAADPAFGERLKALGMVARADTPAEFAARIEAPRAHRAEAARAHGAKPPR